MGRYRWPEAGAQLQSPPRLDAADVRRGGRCHWPDRSQAGRASRRRIADVSQFVIAGLDPAIYWAERLHGRVGRTRTTDGSTCHIARGFPPRTAAPRPGAYPPLSLHAFAVHRLRMPALADLLALCRGSNRALRPVGRRLDDAGAAAALPAVRHVRP